jgi:hypothetical protein
MSNLEKKNIYFPTYRPPTLIYLSHRITTASKPAVQNLLIAVSVTSAPPFQPLRHQQNVCHVSRPSCKPFYKTNTFHCKQETFLYEDPLHLVICPQKEHNRTMLFGSIHKHGRQFGNWNQPLNMSMRVCYVDCHETGLCCYLVMHIENLLRPLQLLYFHFWPIYWLPRNWGRCYQDFSSLPLCIVRSKNVQCNYLVQVDCRCVLGANTSVFLKTKGLGK